MHKNYRLLKIFLLFLPAFPVCAQEPADWLVQPVSQKAGITQDGRDIILQNGLVKRIFRIGPNIACYDYKNLATGQQLLRAVKPEAGIIIAGKEYAVGGLRGQKENAYLLPPWLDQMTAGPPSEKKVKTPGCCV